jgi:hypothetical protein
MIAADTNQKIKEECRSGEPDEWSGTDDQPPGDLTLQGRLSNFSAAVANLLTFM